MPCAPLFSTSSRKGNRMTTETFSSGCTVSWLTSAAHPREISLHVAAENCLSFSSSSGRQTDFNRAWQLPSLGCHSCEPDGLLVSNSNESNRGSHDPLVNMTPSVSITLQSLSTRDQYLCNELMGRCATRRRTWASSSFSSSFKKAFWN